MKDDFSAANLETAARKAVQALDIAIAAMQARGVGVNPHETAILTRFVREIFLCHDAVESVRPFSHYSTMLGPGPVLSAPLRTALKTGFEHLRVEMPD